MYAHITSIQQRLQAALGPSWTVTDGTEAQDRRPLPRADVRLQGARLTATSGPGVTLQAGYIVTLVVQAGAAAQPFALLDAAVDSTIAQLHHWRPEGAQARLALQELVEVEASQLDLFGFALRFALTTTRQGSGD